MATTYFSTNTELGLVNALTQSLTIFLPQNAPTGKNLFIKDAAGNSTVSTITIQAQGSDTFEDGSTKQFLNSAYESMQLTYNPTKWYITGGTMFNSMNISSVITNNLNAINISTSYISLSSLSLLNKVASTNTFNVVSSLLYYNNNLVGGGFREAIPQNINILNFQPYINSNLAIWFDSSKTSSFTFSGTSNLTKWNNQSFWTTIQTGTATNNALWSTIGANNTNAVYFNGTTSGFFTTYAQIATESLFAVIYTPTGGTIVSPKNGLTGFRQIFITNLNSSNSIIQTNSQSSGVALSAGGISTNTLNLIEVITSNSYLAHYVNGSFANSNASVFSNDPTASNQLGVINFFNTYYNGFMSEVIIYSNTVSPPFRQNVEGYLAWKWGIQNKLPTNHPYYNYPPP